LVVNYAQLKYLGRDAFALGRVQRSGSGRWGAYSVWRGCKCPNRQGFYGASFSDDTRTPNSDQYAESLRRLAV